MTATIDTPRTDAFCVELPATNFDCDCWLQVIAIADFARQLERELAESMAEVERLRHLLTEASYRIHEPDFVREIEETLNQNNK